MATDVKKVELERQTTASNPNGTFGFSVLGGAGTKFPAVVCDVDAGGPADSSGKIQVGDRLTFLNGENLDDLTPNDLVQRIRSAPSPSLFVLREDESVREQILSLLKKQEKRRQQRALHQQQQQQHQQSPKKVGVAAISERERRKKVIEVEPSVNRASGGDNMIVQVVDDRIVGQVVTVGGEEGGVRGVEAGRKRSPHRSPKPHRPGGIIWEENGTASHSPSILDRKPHLTPLQGLPTKSVSMDNFTRHGGGVSSRAGEMESREQNGVNFSGSSGLNYTPNSGSLSSFDERRSDGKIAETEGQGATSGGRTTTPPSVDENRARHNRGSQSEGALVNEISRPPEKDPTEVSKAPAAPKWIDPDEKQRIMERHHMSPTRKDSRKQADRSSQAVTLARKLYMLDGFKRSEVAARLSQPTEFGQAVAREYLSLFDFPGLRLSDALRQFLGYFSLTGESQERERVMQHFSERYYQCNPHSWPSSDAVHGLCIAILLLNTDLHTDHGGRKMSLAQFTDNLGHIGVDLPKDMLKETYEDIKRHALQWALDDDQVIPGTGKDVEEEEEEEVEEEERVYHITIPGTFVQAMLPGSAPVFKEGFVMKKNIMEAPHKKVSRGKRQWKAYYAYLKGFLLYFAPPQGQGELHLDDTSSAITVTHCLTMRAHDYHKKSSVVRVTTADWRVFLLQATDVTDMQQWIGAINKAAALYSSPPLAAPIGSEAGFHRPTFPLAPTRNSQDQQVESHEVKVKALEKESKEHQAKKPTGKNAKHGHLEEWFDHYEFLLFETNRFRIYLASLCSDAIVDFNAPLPSGLIPSPSVNTLHNPDHASGESDFLEEFHRTGHSSHIVGTPPTTRSSGNNLHNIGAPFTRPLS